MAQSKQCNDIDPHPRHDWYGPTDEKGQTGQKEYTCPGVSASGK